MASEESAGPVIRTGRLLLRPLRLDDLPHLQRYATRPDFYRYLPGPAQTAATVAVFLEQRMLDAWDQPRTHWVFAIEPLEVGHIVGTVRTSIVNAQEQTADLGYAMDLDFHSRGYMTEAAQAALKFAFHELGMHRIWATVDPENAASCRVLERLGMRREGHFRKDKLVRGEWRDTYLYALLKEEYK